MSTLALPKKEIYIFFSSQKLGSLYGLKRIMMMKIRVHLTMFWKI